MNMKNENPKYLLIVIKNEIPNIIILIKVLTISIF